MKWGLISTSGTYSTFRIAPNGLGMEISVKTGCEIWHLVSPKPGYDFQDSFGGPNSFADSDLKGKNLGDVWDIETVILTDGIQLYVPIFVSYCS